MSGFSFDNHFTFGDNSSVFDMNLAEDVANIIDSQFGSTSLTRIQPKFVDEEEELDVVGFTPESYHQTKGNRPLLGRPPAKRKLQMDLSSLAMDLTNTVGFKTPSPPKIRKKPAKSPKASGTKSPSEKSRYETSLGLLTKRFVNLLRRAPDGILDLNRAAEELNVQKRRIYDITNVLEGIKLITKRQKNNIEWKGSSSYTAQDANGQQICTETLNLQSENNNLAMQEKNLDDLIRSASLQLKMLTEDPENKRYAYVTYHDIRSIHSFEDQTVIAIKAPPETKLEVPDPKDGIQIWLKSTRGQIEVYLCPEECRKEDETLPTEQSSPTTPKSGPELALKVNALEEDDLSDLGRNLLLTEDQNPAFQDDFVPLSPPAVDDYLFALGDNEGISDLFDDFFN